jgi:hypothetical protein
MREDVGVAEEAVIAFTFSLTFAFFDVCISSVDAIALIRPDSVAPSSSSSLSGSLVMWRS